MLLLPSQLTADVKGSERIGRRRYVLSFPSACVFLIAASMAACHFLMMRVSALRNGTFSGAISSIRLTAGQPYSTLM